MKHKQKLMAGIALVSFSFVSPGISAEHSPERHPKTHKEYNVGDNPNYPEAKHHRLKSDGPHQHPKTRKNYNRSKDLKMENDAYLRNRQYTLIEDLPEEGQVMISGTVSGIDNEKGEIILADISGETINVQSRHKTHLSVGDEITVTGRMEDEFLFFGDVIVADKVIW